MDADLWAALPWDLLLDIIRRLDDTAVVRSAAACRPWRRAIIGNASCLGPRPALLLGFFHTSEYFHHPIRPHRGPGPFADVLTAAKVRRTGYATLLQRCSPSAPSFAQAAAGNGGGSGVALYTRPLSSRDGFVLLGHRAAAAADLCLCNPMTGSCRVLPAAAPDVSAAGASYVLVTGHDVSPSPPTDADGDDAVWILAVKHGEDVRSGMTYQIFSSAAPGGGEWGPVKRSARFLEEGSSPAYRNGEAKDVVVCRGGAVYWLGVSSSRRRRRAFAIDVRTERTWTTELPEKYVALDRRTWYFSLALAKTTSGADDGQLSLVVSLPSRRIEVWVLVGDGRWTLRRMIDLQKLVRNQVWLTTFCPRSGCILGHVEGWDDLLIPVDEVFPDPVRRIIGSRVSSHPYEMDWSTYISKMKYF